ncbi:hypothetical protein HMPREF0476_1150 [Kingella kingae ATCC 23330]|uniref:Uncharacterized protein n=1 Tax=Kingella kingae ATCC 23330 TaxID=887327 RepID=F5S7G7_KINKI|nr:hypothetical protein HMPREF0476_1150 [Kingella kingae ATCC 23330]
MPFTDWIFCVILWNKNGWKNGYNYNRFRAKNISKKQPAL